MKMRQGAQVQIVSIKAVCWLALRPLDLGGSQLRLNGTYHIRGYSVLQIENVCERAIEAIRPDMAAGCGLDELAGDANAAAAPAHASFWDVAHAELRRHLLHICDVALVGSGRAFRVD